MRTTLTLGLIQHTCGDDWAGNIATTEKGIRNAVAQGAELILLQELHAGPYFCQVATPDNFDYAETIPGPTTEHFAKVAAELDVVIVTSIFERRGPGLHHNTAVVLDKQRGIVGMYRKMHIPDDPGYYEKFYFTPGDLGFQPIETSLGKLGVLVCWDQWFPEAARLMALAGADILLYPTAIGWDERDTDDEQERQRDAWITVQRAHAVANGIPLAACNRIGTEPDPSGASNGIHFWGSSFIAGPQGEFLAQAGTEEENTLVARIDFQRTEQVRRIWPYLRDRRIDAYADILKRYRD